MNDSSKRFLFWVAVLAVVVLIGWLPTLIPTAILALIGHIVLSGLGIGAIVAVILYGYAEAMQS